MLNVVFYAKCWREFRKFILSVHEAFPDDDVVQDVFNLMCSIERKFNKF